jgi:cell wall-associated NlpC family hydrolase
LPVKGAYLAFAGAGAIILWSGLKGKSWTDVVRQVITGQSPANLANINSIQNVGFQSTGNPNATAVSPGAVTGSINGTAIANDALKYIGHPYLYGGAPGPNGQNPWDCSSFVNWVLNHDLMSPIPGYSGGQWNPSTHGPATTSYLTWTGGQTVSRSNVSAGDLLVWSGHIGIALNNTQMVSALNPRITTEVTGIENGGPGGSPLRNIRVALCR